MVYRVPMVYKAARAFRAGGHDYARGAVLTPAQVADMNLSVLISNRWVTAEPDPYARRLSPREGAPTSIVPGAKPPVPADAPPTRVTAGTPGSFSGGSGTLAVPANLAALQALGALGQTTAWTQGQNVALKSGTAYWNGTAWVAGSVPPPAPPSTTYTGVKSAVVPGATFAADPAVSASAVPGASYVASPTTAWTAGQKMTVGTLDFTWNGTAWVAYVPPAPAPPADPPIDMSGTVPEVLAAVGDDPQLAAWALAQEQGRPSPRITLLGALTDIVNRAGQA